MSYFSISNDSNPTKMLDISITTKSIGLKSSPDEMLNFEDVHYFGEIKQVSLLEAAVKITLYVIVMIVSIFGNGIVIATICKSRRMHKTTNYYIVNLAVSDLLVAVSCGWVHLVDDLTEGWVLGSFFCKFNSFMQVLSHVSSMLTLMLVACDRFFGIVFALKALVTERRSWLAIFIVWIFSISISAPLLFCRQQFTRKWLDHTEIWCEDTWPAYDEFDPVRNITAKVSRVRTIYFTSISLVLYFIPVVVIFAAYLAIIYKLWIHQPPGEAMQPAESSRRTKVKKRVIQMLFLIMIAFSLCWLPYQISILYNEYRPEKDRPFPGWYKHVVFFSIFLAYANSALNPVIYVFFNSSFRKCFIETFRFKKGYRSAITEQMTVECRSSSGNNRYTIDLRLEETASYRFAKP